MSAATKTRPAVAKETPQPAPKIPAWYGVALQATQAAAACVWRAMLEVDAGTFADGDGDGDGDQAYRVLAFAAERLSGMRGDAGRALFSPDSSEFTTDMSATLYDAGALMNAACRAWAFPAAAQACVDRAMIIIDATATMLDSGPDEAQIPGVMAAIADAPAMPRARLSISPVSYSDGCHAVTERQRDVIWECAERATSFSHMLFDLTREDDDINPKLGINDPASRTQRQFACIAAIQHELEVIDGALGYGTEGQTS